MCLESSRRKPTCITDQYMDPVRLLLDFFCCCMDIDNICQVALHEGNSGIELSERDAISVSPFFADGVESIDVSGNNDCFIDSV